MIAALSLKNELNNERGKSKVQLVMQNNCISVKNFEDTRIIYSASKPVEIFMGSDTKDVIDRLLDTILERFQQAIETSNDNRSGFTHESVGLLYYCFMKIDIRRAEPPDWISNRRATIHPKNEKDKCFQWSITSAVNYNKNKTRYLKKIKKIKMVDIDLLSHQRDWEEFEQNNTLIALNVLFVKNRTVKK